MLFFPMTVSTSHQVRVASLLSEPFVGQRMPLCQFKLALGDVDPVCLFLHSEGVGHSEWCEGVCVVCVCGVRVSVRVRVWCEGEVKVWTVMATTILSYSVVFQGQGPRKGPWVPMLTLVSSFSTINWAILPRFLVRAHSRHPLSQSSSMQLCAT